jgi:hypothetical protein
MISYRIGFSECEHGPASNRQHARKRLFNESRPACQEQNSDQFGKHNFALDCRGEGTYREHIPQWKRSENASAQECK